MAFKYTCILLLVSLAFLLAQAKHVKKDKKGNTKQKDPQKFKTYYDRVKYKGEWKDCDDFNTNDSSGTGCNCPFVACTGSQQCTTLSGINCRFLHKNVDVNNMSREDCACEYLGK